MTELHVAEIHELLEQIQSHATHAFSGVGLIFYSRLDDLPVVALGDQALFSPRLPVADRSLLAPLLADISSLSSPWHDGFHLIDSNSFTLTHISQFLSPPVEYLQVSNSRALPVGARHMTAMACSRIATVSHAALLSSKNGAAVFHRGSLLEKTELRSPTS